MGQRRLGRYGGEGVANNDDERWGKQKEKEGAGELIIMSEDQDEIRYSGVSLLNREEAQRLGSNLSKGSN